MFYLEKEEVFITEDGMVFDEVKELYKRDRRNESKPFFKKCITYIYWAYKKDGELRLLLPSKRRKKAAEIAGVDEKEMEDNKEVKAVIKLYNHLNKSSSELLMDASDKRVEETIEWLNNIPLQKKSTHKIKVSYEHPITKEIEWTEIYVPVEIDNSDEVKKALQMANLLTDQRDLLQKKIIKENIQKKNDGRIFDR